MEVANATQKMNLVELMMKGGWLMAPLVLLFFTGCTIFFERYWFIRTTNKFNHKSFERIMELLKKEDTDGAQSLCKELNTPESRIIHKGINNLGRPIRDIHEQMEMEGRLEIYQYEKHVNYLGIIAGIAPMLGFIGTISGVIKIFYSISLADNISISLISNGLYEKLITSGFGLGIGILAFAGYHILNSMIEKTSHSWEFHSVRFIDTINK